MAFDLGTEGTKTSIVSAEGEIVASEFTGYDVRYPKPCWAEQDPETWWGAVAKNTKEVIRKSGISPDDIIGVGGDGMMFTVLPLDEEGRPLRPAIIWLDTRAEEQVGQYFEGLERDLIELLDDGIIPAMSAKDFIPKILWLKDNEPEMFERAQKFVDSKDYIVYKCTGKFNTDWTCACLTGLFSFKKKRWDSAMIEITGLTPERFPEATSPTNVVGELKGEAAKELGLPEGIPVISGSGDPVAIALGTGAIKEKKPHLYIGSSSWVALHLKEPLFSADSGIGSICSADPSKLLAIGQMENAGSCLKWLRDNVFREEKNAAEATGKNAYSIMDEMAEKVNPGSDSLIFMPWMSGERCPFIDSTARGGFINLGFNHGRGHMARAVMEGVAFNIRWILEGFEDLGLSIGSLNASGGGARSDFWLQVISDITGKVIDRVSSPLEAGSRGVAMMVGLGLGIYKEFDPLEDLVLIEKEFYPRDDNKKTYDKIYNQFKKSYESLTDIHCALNL